MRRRGGPAATSPCVRRCVAGRHTSLHAPPPLHTHTNGLLSVPASAARAGAGGGELRAGARTPTHAGGEEVVGSGSEVNWRHALAAPLCVCASHPHPPCWAAPRTRTHAHTGAAPTSRCAWQGRGEGGVGLPGGKPDFGGTQLGWRGAPGGRGWGWGRGGSRRRGWGWRARGTRAGNSAGGGDAACRAPLAHTHTPPSLASIPPSLCLLLLSGHQHVQQQLGGQEDQPRLVAVARHPRCCLRAHTPQPSQPASGRPGWRVLVVSGTRQCVG